MTGISALRAVSWSAADVILRQGVQFGVAIALARLLTPADFGTVSLLYLFAGIAGTFATGGLTTALIQAREVSRADESTVFWFNLAVGVLMGVAFWLCGPLIARFYEAPVLEPLSTVMAVTVVITAAGGIQQALLTKHLNFRPLMMSSVLAVLTSGAVSIWLAWRGEGVWALAAQSLVSAATATLVLWIANPWRPQWVFSLASARRLFGFGGYMMAASLLDVVYSRLYTVLIGKLYGARELGFYARAETTAQLPSSMLGLIVGRVAFPLFSRMGDDPERVRDGLKRALQATMFVNTPVMLGLAAIAEPLIQVMFGEAWLPCVPYFQVLCIAGVFMPFHVLNLQVLMGLGRSELFFRLEVAKKVLGILILCMAAMFGVLAMAWGTLLGSVLFFGINTYYSNRLIGYGTVMQLRDVGVILGTAAVMAGLVVVMAPHLAIQAPLRLLALSLSGALAYALLAFALKVPGVQPVTAMLRRRAN